MEFKNAKLALNIYLLSEYQVDTLTVYNNSTIAVCAKTSVGILPIIHLVWYTPHTCHTPPTSQQERDRHDRSTATAPPPPPPLTQPDQCLLVFSLPVHDVAEVRPVFVADGGVAAVAVLVPTVAGCAGGRQHHRDGHTIAG